MKTYFCPSCARALESRDCAKRGTHFARLLCPDCRAKVRVAGGALVAAGLITILLTGLVLCAGVPTLGLLAGVPLIALGLLRLVEQWRAARRARRGSRAELLE